MIRVLENQEKKLYYATSSDWECVVLAKDAIEAAAEALEEAFDTFGDNLATFDYTFRCLSKNDNSLARPEIKNNAIDVNKIHIPRSSLILELACHQQKIFSDILCMKWS